MKLETVQLPELKPLDKNVRYHTEIQVKEFARSLKQFGQTRPFVIDDDNNILVGNCMFLAMQKAGYTEATAYRIAGLSKAKKKKLILSDNRIYALGGDNSDVIEDYIREIASIDDLDIAGFDESSLRELIRDVQEVESSIMNYGTVSNDTIENTQSSQTSAASQPEAAQQNASLYQSQQVSEQENQGAEIIKTVICPNCGEVIRI